MQGNDAARKYMKSFPSAGTGKMRYQQNKQMQVGGDSHRTMQKKDRKKFSRARVTREVNTRIRVGEVLCIVRGEFERMDESGDCGTCLRLEALDGVDSVNIVRVSFVRRHASQ